MRAGRLRILLFFQCAVLLVPPISALAEPYSALQAQPAYGNPSNDLDDSEWSYEPVFGGCYVARPPACFGTVVFDFLLMNRSQADVTDLVTENGGPVILNTTGLPLGAAPGFRFTWTSESDCGTDLQVAFLTSHDFQTSRVVTGGDIRGILFNALAATASTSVTTEYESLLDSLELNLRTRQWSRIAPLAGFRILQLQDTIMHTGDTGVIEGVCDNELYGFQLGFEGVIVRQGRWSLESTVKAGVFYNDLDVSGNSANINFSKRFDQTAFIGEANLFMRYYITPRMSFKAGYQGLWIDGIALMPDQFDDFDIGLTPVQGRADLTTVGYHGGLLGFELTW